MTLSRRHFLGGAAGLSGLPMVGRAARAQSAEPIRLGLLTVKTGPLASGGIDMERGLQLYLKDHNGMMGGRKVDLISVDTGGNPAQARSKAQELSEKNHVHAFIGPLAAFEALAIDDYIRSQQIPTLSVAAAEDLTQRKLNPFFVRGTSTSSQCAMPLADYCAKDLKYKTMITIASDTAYGQEMAAGFQRVFEDAGGKIIQKLWPPLNAPDYATYVAQLNSKADALFSAFEGSNGFRFTRQFLEYGVKLPIVGGMTHLDESLLRNMGDEVVGTITSCWYSAELDNPINKAFAAEFRKDFSYDPGFYGAATYVEGAILDAAVTAIGGKIEDKPALMKALHATKIDTARGTGALRRIRQCRRQRLHPQGDAQGRTAGEFGHQDVPGCQPVLDLRSEGILEEPCLFTRFPAGEEPRKLDGRDPLFGQRH